jgi:hypothetical protein
LIDGSFCWKDKYLIELAALNLFKTNDVVLEIEFVDIFGLTGLACSRCRKTVSVKSLAVWGTLFKWSIDLAMLKSSLSLWKGSTLPDFLVTIIDVFKSYTSVVVKSAKHTKQCLRLQT